MYELNGIIQIRWVASDYNAIRAIHRMWKPLVVDLYDIENNANFDPKTKTKAKKRRYHLLGKNFLIMFHLIFDVLNEISVVSQKNVKKRRFCHKCPNLKEKSL